MSDNSYAKQRLNQALESLVEEGPLRRRLTYATVHLLILRSVYQSRDTIRNRIESLVEELTKEPLRTTYGYGPPTHISPKRAKAIAQEILSLYTEVQGGL